MSISCQFRCSSFPKDFGETRGRQARASISSFRRSTTQHKKRRKPSRRAWVGNWEVRYRSQQGFTGMKYVFREIVCASIVTQGENHRLRIDLAKHFHFAILFVTVFASSLPREADSRFFFLLPGFPCSSLRCTFERNKSSSVRHEFLRDRAYFRPPLMLSSGSRVFLIKYQSRGKQRRTLRSCRRCLLFFVWGTLFCPLIEFFEFRIFPLPAKFASLWDYRLRRFIWPLVNRRTSYFSYLLAVVFTVYSMRCYRVTLIVGRGYTWSVYGLLMSMVRLLPVSCRLG